MRLIVAGVILGASTYASPWVQYIPMGISAIKGVYDAVSGSSSGDSTSASPNGLSQSPPGSQNDVNVKTVIEPSFKQNFKQPITITSGNIGKEESPKSEPSPISNVPENHVQPLQASQHINQTPQFNHNQPPPNQNPSYPQGPAYNPNQYPGHDQSIPNPNYSEPHPNDHHPQGYYNPDTSPWSNNPQQNSGFPPSHPQRYDNQFPPGPHNYQTNPNHYPNGPNPNPYGHPANSYPQAQSYQDSRYNAQQPSYNHDYRQDTHQSRNNGNSHNYYQDPHHYQPHQSNYQPPYPRQYPNNFPSLPQTPQQSPPPYHHQKPTGYQGPTNIIPNLPNHELNHLRRRSVTPPPSAIKDDKDYEKVNQHSEKRATGYQGPTKVIPNLPDHEFDQQRMQKNSTPLHPTQGKGDEDYGLIDQYPKQRATGYQGPTKRIPYPAEHVAFDPNPHHY